jgi:hypothetical protein
MLTNVLVPPELSGAAWRTDIGNVGDILGTRKRENGDAGKLLTDTRETSYLI